MKKTTKGHTVRSSHITAEYDDSQDSDEHHACVSLVVHYADPSPEDVVFDLGIGTSAITLAFASDAKRVVGRGISKGMLEQARTKAAGVSIESVESDEGRFRGSNVGDDEQIDIVVTNFAIHHLFDEGKRETIGVITDPKPRRLVLGGAMFLGTPDLDESFYPPEVDDPATVDFLVDALTDVGFVLTTVESIHEQVGVFVTEQVPAVGE